MAQKITLAGIDIGSNAMRLIISDVVANLDSQQPSIKKNTYVRLPLRLGNDVFKTNVIGEEKYNKFLDGISIFKQLIDFYEVDNYHAVATSAMRNAKNGKQLCQDVKKASGIDIEIINGKREAQLLAKILQSKLPQNNYYLSLDLGGGSLDTSLFYNAEIINSESFKIGTVRLLNGIIKDKEILRLGNFLSEVKQSHPNVKLIGSGGNINKISKIIGSPILHINDIKTLSRTLGMMNITERMQQYNLKHDRVDVIIPAAEIFIKILSHLNIDEIYIPKLGIGDAVIYEILTTKMQ